MSRYLDPRADVVFKRIFGEHPHLLISFLNAVLPFPDDRKIVTLTYLPSESVPKIPTLKRTIADVRCTDNTGRVFIVEMQINWTDSFKQRLLFETSQAYVKQLEKGEDYHLLEPVYGLGLISASFDKSEEWYHHYQLVNVVKPVKEIIEGLQLIFVELPKFKALGARDTLRLLWLRFLREINQNTQEVSPELLAVPEIQEAVQLAEEAAYTAGEMLAYEEYWDAVRIERTIKHDAHAKGKAEGKVEGKLEERKATFATLRRKGLTDAAIIDLLEITAEELEALK